MRLLFVQEGFLVKYDNEGNAYVAGNEDRRLWTRYGKYCDELIMIMKNDGKIYTKAEALSKGNIFDQTLAKIVSVPNTHTPYKNLFNLRIRAEANRIISEEVRKADRVIVRPMGWLSRTVLKMCRKYNKPYVIEIIDCPFDICRYSGNFLKQLAAPYIDMICRREIARAPYVVYVTQHEQQKRYPSHGKSMGCSDVELMNLDDDILESRIARIHQAGNNHIILGTAGVLGTEIKGHKYVIRALSLLKSEGITNIEYRLAGGGLSDYLKSLAESLGVSAQVKFDGLIPHEKIFDWYDSLDAYIQPSLTEGLCRALIEAMSRALPVACSNVGGNPELADEKMLFQAGNVKQIASVIREFMKPEVREREAVRSFTRAHDFEKDKLDVIRGEFYSSFTGVKKW